ncbi:glycosyltransferase family 2 protein [Butyrivibrio sp. MC2021]|uniref:glycosyltransferase family 2 protein n=1 Tax=Butyrivibrio sp. MC2021 TaxID=1408306 RepID=UPI00047B5487|nr:glycosyltransferase [Butyrivibrio sp. MC2021]
MAEFKTKISVIIPAYNIEKLLPKCVESVASSDYPAELLEIIVVDDGSTDGTGAVADELAARFSNVTVYHQKNGGSSSARNLGISKASGEYLGFVDSDDFIDPKMYSRLAEAAIRTGADMVQIGRDEICEDGSRLPDVITVPEKELEISPKEHLATLLMHTGDASFCTKLTKKSALGDMRFPEGELNEDFYLMIHVLPRINKLVILPHVGYHVFYRLGSNSRKKAEDKDYFPSVFTDIVRNSDVALDLVKKEYPDLVPVAERFGYYQRLDYLLHIPVSKMTRNNKFYREVVSYVRKNLGKIRNNPHLSKRDRVYLQILAPAPRLVRWLHARVRGL